MTKVAKHNGVSVPSVHAAIKRVGEWVKQRKFDDIIEYRERHTAALERIADEAWESWQKSIRLSEVTEPDPLDETKTITTEGIGDPRYLAEYRAAMSDIRKVWGADKAPEMPDESGFRWAGKPREQALSEYASEQIEFLQGMLKAAPGN